MKDSVSNGKCGVSLRNDSTGCFLSVYCTHACTHGHIHHTHVHARITLKHIEKIKPTPALTMFLYFSSFPFFSSEGQKVNLAKLSVRRGGVISRCVHISSYRCRKRRNKIWEGFPVGKGANTSNRKAQNMRVCTKCFSQARRNPARFLVGFLYDEVLRNLCFCCNTQEKRKTRKGGSLWWQSHQLENQREFQRKFCVILPVFSSGIKAVHELLC